MITTDGPMVDEKMEEIKHKISHHLDFCEDYTVLKNVLHFLERSVKGKEKYGVTLDRNDLSFKDWSTHLKEELMDGVNYLERLMNY